MSSFLLGGWVRLLLEKLLVVQPPSPKVHYATSAHYDDADPIEGIEGTLPVANVNRPGSVEIIDF